MSWYRESHRHRLARYGIKTKMYHGSTKRGIKTLVPKKRFVPTKKMGEAVYASDIPSFSVAHSIPWSSNEGVNLTVKNKQNKEKNEQYLYHGTPKKNIDVLEPKTGTRMGVKEKQQKGKSVHATSDKQIAVGYMLNYDLWGTQLKDRWATATHDDPPIVVIGDREKLKKADKGGTLFKIKNSNLFERAVDRKDSIQSPNEYRSKQRIKPVDKIEYDSVIDAMIDNDMQVYIVSKKDWEKYIGFYKDSKTWKEGDKLSANFLKTLKSENQKRNKKVYPEVNMEIPKNLKDRFNQPVSLYEVEPKNFKKTKSEETGYTFHSKEPVVVKEEKRYDSFYNAMKKNGGKVVIK